MMDTMSLCSRKRPCCGAEVQLHQKLQCQPPAWKRRFREEEEEVKKRKSGGYKKNTDPHLQRDPRTQDLKQELRRFSQFRTRTTIWTGSENAAEIQSTRPGIRVALIRKTTIHTPVQNLELRGSKLAPGLTLKEQTDPGFRGDLVLDQRRPTPNRLTRFKESTSEVRSWSTASPVPYESSETRTSNKKKSEKKLGPQSPKGKGETLRTRPMLMGRATQIKTRRRKKIHPSVFRGRGQLRLSITPEVGQLIIHIHEARGLMGKSQRSCDSYVKLMVTSDLGYSVGMKTQMVLNNKNPKYDESFRLCVSDDLLLGRLLVSVFRRPGASRCSQLVGCMSFGIGSLVLSYKLIIGWFYLLGEELGWSKHLRVTSQQNRPMRCFEEDEQTECADLRRTPDSAPDTNLNHVTTSTTAGLKDLANHSLTDSLPPSLDPANTNQQQESGDSINLQRLTVSIVRGQDGFGFTICSDCPVRVQAVDPGGPAHQSGLHQGDSILQLNGLPVETWKCVDLAHAIRCCPTQIVLVVWRGLSELRFGCDALLHPPAHNNTTDRKLLPHPTHSKHGRQWGQGLRVRSSLGALGSLWKDRKEDREMEEEEEDQEVTEYSPHTTTLKGTRVTSSNGDNYIILSPVNPGEQLLQPVYHHRTGAIGQLYQTHPSRRQNPLHNPPPGLSQRPFTSCTSTLPPPPSATTSSSALPSNCSTYQNCTIIQSHLPCSTYGTYITLAPKTVIFPVFVQPLDLCSPDRTLLMLEEVILHQADLLPAKVTVLIYSDLLLLTREDEANRCNVLQSPVYLNTLQLRELSSEPLHIYVLQNSQIHCRRLFSLECFSIEQKVRVSLCLHDNIQLQMVTTETAPSHQLPDLPSDFGLLSLGQSDHLLPPSSPYSSFFDTLRPPSPSPYCPTSPFSSTPPPPPVSSLSSYTSTSPAPRTINTLPHHLPPAPMLSSSTLGYPLWKERGRAEEEDRRKRRQEEEVEEVEERQQGEGESASESSENMGSVGRRKLLLSPHCVNMKKEEEEDSCEDKEEGAAEELISSFRPAVLRRSFSEGSLLQEPRSPRFLSDSTIHRLTRPVTFDLDPELERDPRPPSPHTLRKQLTRGGGSLHHMLLLLNGNKDPESKNLQLRKKTKSLAVDVRSRLLFLQRCKNGSWFHSNSLEKALRNNRPSAGEVLSWAEGLETLLTNQYGLAVFRHFLRSEFSEENLDFWLAVERFKRTHPSKMATRAEKIYAEFISTSGVRQVNVDSSVRELTNQSLHLGVHPTSFQVAQDQVFGLMETDSYPRFLRSRLYTQLANRGTAMVLANQDVAGSVSQS